VVEVTRSMSFRLELVRIISPGGYGEQGSPKYEKAAMRWLERYLVEGSPRLQHFAEITASLAKLERSS